MVEDKKKDTKKKASVVKGKIKVTQIRSGIGHPGDQKRTLLGLGLKKINKVSILEDTPSIRGMVSKVGHLVKFEKI
jgi:large subunit ribosomal protein L30